MDVNEVHMKKTLSITLCHLSRQVLPYVHYIDIWGTKGYGFSAILVINRVSIVAILVINRVWFLNYTLELICYFLNKLLFHHY